MIWGYPHFRKCPKGDYVGNTGKYWNQFIEWVYSKMAMQNNESLKMGKLVIDELLND